MPTEITKTDPVAEKISDYEIKITRTITTTSVEPKSLVFTRTGLNKQRADILDQRNGQIADITAKRDAELAEVDAYLSEADKLGIVEEEITEGDTIEVK